MKKIFIFSILSFTISTTFFLKAMDLHEAAGLGYIEEVRRLLTQGIAADTVKPLSGTALSCAAINGYTAVVRLLLEHGADPDAREPFPPRCSIIERTEASIKITQEGSGLVAKKDEYPKILALLKEYQKRKSQ